MTEALDCAHKFTTLRNKISISLLFWTLCFCCFVAQNS